MENWVVETLYCYDYVRAADCSAEIGALQQHLHIRIYILCLLKFFKGERPLALFSRTK